MCCRLVIPTLGNPVLLLRAFQGVLVIQFPLSLCVQWLLYPVSLLVIWELLNTFLCLSFLLFICFSSLPLIPGLCISKLSTDTVCLPFLTNRHVGFLSEDEALYSFPGCSTFKSSYCFCLHSTSLPTAWSSSTWFPSQPEILHSMIHAACTSLGNKIVKQHDSHFAKTCFWAYFVPAAICRNLFQIWLFLTLWFWEEEI